MSTQFATREGRETIAVPRSGGLALPFDLTLALAAIGLGICSVLDSWVWPPVDAACTPPGWSRNGTALAPWPPNR